MTAGERKLCYHRCHSALTIRALATRPYLSYSMSNHRRIILLLLGGEGRDEGGLIKAETRGSD